MSTTAPTRVTDLARRHRLDINTVADPGTGYVQLMGVEEAKLVEEPRTVADEVYEDDGAMREAVTGYSWRIEVKLKHSLNLAGTSRDTVHAFIRAKFIALRSASAAASEFGIRWYDREGIAGEASEGRVYVKSWAPDGGTSQDTIAVVLQGQGALAEITNPAASQLPVVTGLSDATGPAAGGELIQIYGNHLTAATGVDFGATAASDYDVISDSLVVAVAPAHAAGMVQVKVTTAAGVSANTSADDYTYV